MINSYLNETILNTTQGNNQPVVQDILEIMNVFSKGREYLLNNDI